MRRGRRAVEDDLASEVVRRDVRRLIGERGRLVAIAVAAPNRTDAGLVRLVSAADGSLLGQVSVGAQPDMLVFTPDGRRLLVANEGEPSDDYSVDPPGTLSIIELGCPGHALTQADVRTVSLTDLNVPILAFVGLNDELARPPAVRAIESAAPHGKVQFASIQAGHFGLVVGSRAMTKSWPAVVDWIEGRGLRVDEEPARGEPSDLDVELELLLGTVRGAWNRLGETIARASDVADTVRYQQPRLKRLSELAPDDLTSPSRELARRAEKSPDATFFLYRGRAFTYRQANERVTNVARGLWSCGVRPGDRVGVVMASRLKSANPTFGKTYELYVIAAVVVGGTSLSGGSGRMLDTLIGALIIAVMQNGMNLLNGLGVVKIDDFGQSVVLGVVLLLAVVLDQWRQRHRRP